MMQSATIMDKAAIRKAVHVSRVNIVNHKSHTHAFMPFFLHCCCLYVFDSLLVLYRRTESVADASCLNQDIFLKKKTKYIVWVASWIQLTLPSF